MFKIQQGLAKMHPASGLLTLLMLLMLSIPVVVSAAEPALLQSAAGLIQETNNGLVWQMERSKKIRSLPAVEKYLHQLNQGPYHDWRLPTKWELYDFFSKFDLKKNGDINISLEGSYWLKDDDGSIHAGSWETGDQCGTERTFYTTKSGYLRAVRP
ncbi:MAG: hypothetical protein AB7U29_13020 [Desulfobulbus sp.]